MTNRLLSNPPRSPADNSDAGPRRVYLRAVSSLVALLILSVLIRVASVAPQTQEWTLALLMTQIGIFMLVFYVVLSVYVYRARRAAAAANILANTPTDTCPDYWTRSASNQCTNVYDTPDGKYKYSVGDKKRLQVALGVAADIACRPGAGPDAYPWVYLKNVCNAYQFNSKK